LFLGKTSTDHCDYDTDNDSKVDLFPQVATRNKFSPEVILAIDNLSTKPSYGGYDGILLIFNKYDGVKVVDGKEKRWTKFAGGRMPMEGRVGAIYYHDLARDRDLLCKTIAHELGHGLFGLMHPFNEFDYPPPNSSYPVGSDPMHLMNYEKHGTELKRYYIWKKIHE